VFLKDEKMKSRLQELKIRRVVFLREQDGMIERQLKTLWEDYFKSNIYVTWACLARVRYADSSEEKVALCLRADIADRKTLVEQVSSDFRKLFKTTESLDVIFLSSEEQRILLLVAQPFYEQHAHQT
jgi:hypothetical protein